MIGKRRQTIWLLVLAVSCILVFAQAAGAKTVIRISHKYDETNKVHKGFQNVIKGFEAKYPEYTVQIDAGFSDDKVKMSVAAGDPPDINYQWLCAPWGADGVFQPLNSYIAKYKVNSGDFVPAAWNQNVYRNNVYALPLYIDTNFAMLWLKAKFAEVGIPPNQPPKTVADFDAYFKKLTRFDSNGVPYQMGMTPWTIYGNANTIFTWGWIFGGDFYDYQARKATMHDPRIVKALDYLTDYFERYANVYDVLGKGIPTGYGRFTSGREAISFSTPSGALTTLEQFPDLEIGISRMFSDPESGVENPTWIGGFSLGIPTGAKQPEGAFKLIEYMTNDPEGIALWSDYASWMPANIKSPTFRKLGSDPKWRVFTEIAVSTVRYRPAIPMLEAINSQFTALLPKILRRQVLAQAAMEEVSKLVDLEMAQRYSK